MKLGSLEYPFRLPNSHVMGLLVRYVPRESVKAIEEPALASALCCRACIPKIYCLLLCAYDAKPISAAAGLPVRLSYVAISPDLNTV